MAANTTPTVLGLCTLIEHVLLPSATVSGTSAAISQINAAYRNAGMPDLCIPDAEAERLITEARRRAHRRTTPTTGAHHAGRTAYGR